MASTPCHPTTTSPADYPDTDEIDPELAKRLYEDRCAILVIEGLPVGSEFGIDLSVYQTGQKFRGIKLIPPGIHFVYASAIGLSTANTSCRDGAPQFGPRCGFYHEFKTRELLLKRWSQRDEEFEEEPHETPHDQLERYKANLHDLDRFLGAYRFSTFKQFRQLTSNLTPPLIQALVPTCKNIRSVPYLTRQSSPSSNVVTSSETQPVHSFSTAKVITRRLPRRRLNPNQPPEPTEDTLLPELQPSAETIIHFSRIPADHSGAPQSIEHGMITEYNLDTTTKLEQTFLQGSCCDGWRRLLGELEFAFLTFLLCHVYECFEQWKRLLELVCRADKALESPNNTPFFVQFTQSLAQQLELVPADIFEDIVDDNNLVRTFLDTLFQNVDACSGRDSRLTEAANQLRQQVETKFGWCFNLEPEDEQPVLVADPTNAEA